MSSQNFVKKKALADAVAAGASIKDAALAVGVNVKTASRWLLEPELRAMITGAQSVQMSVALCVLLAATVEAAEKLTALLSDPSPKVRLAAACALLDKAMKLRELVDIEERLAALEAEVESRK